LAGPDLYQRAIIAKNGRVATAASLTSGAAYWGLGVIPVFLAFAAITLMSKGVLGADAAALIESDSEMLVLVLAKTVLPGVLAAIFIASLMAAIMSTGDSAIFATAAVLANDIYKPVFESSGKKTLSDRGLVTATRISVAVVTVAALLIGFFYANMYDLLIIGFQLLFHILFFPLILGVYWKRANAIGSIAGMITGFVVILVWMIVAGTMFPSPEWLSSLGPGAAGGLVMIIVSLATQKANPPQPLRATDGSILKWPELAN
jgi:Na+/proline symporter